jgi:hypothetical protein
VEEVNGRRMRVDKEVWERMQGRLRQKALLKGFAEQTGLGMEKPIEQDVLEETGEIGKTKFSGGEEFPVLEGLEGYAEDVVMKGTASVRFGVPDAASGGVVVALNEDSVDGDSGSEWEEKAQSEVDISMVEGKRSDTPGGYRLGEARWLWRSLEELVAETLSEIDLKICSQENWTTVLAGEGVMEKVAVEVLAELIEAEEEVVSEKREEELKLLAGNKMEYWWQALGGTEIWRKVCEVHRAEQEMVDDEVAIVAFGDVLELDQLEELEAERQMDLVKEQDL